MLGRNKAAAYTFLEEQCYRIVAPDMLVYLMKPLDAVCHGKVGKVWGLGRSAYERMMKETVTVAMDSKPGQV